jgi:hypothetical protein
MYTEVRIGIYLLGALDVVGLVDERTNAVGF